MKRKVLCTAFTFLAFCSAAACGRASNVQSESKRISGMTPQYSTSSASNEIDAIQDDTAIQLPGGNVDYSVYEPYGLLYDPLNECYTYNGCVVRHFNDPTAGVSFTNYFTGIIDLEAEYDAGNTLVGVKECSREVYDRHTEKYNSFNSFSAFLSDQNSDASIQYGNPKHNMDSLKDYETYGISFNTEIGGWYYNDRRVKILIDSGITSVYLDDNGNICLSVVRNKDNAISEMKGITEADANVLMMENNPQDNRDFAVEE